MEMFFQFFFYLCLAVYLISILETIGGYILSVVEFGYYSRFGMCVSIFFPPLAPLVAFAICSSAQKLYCKKIRNDSRINESFYCYIFHGFNTITSWADKHSEESGKKSRTPRG